jgi:two-component system KDP operon response regulator KdpE
MSARLLLVDDDATLLRFLGDYLAGEGFEVLTARRGDEALKVCYAERPSLAVVDVMMPGMDGWELCARLRELSSLPIILLSAKAGESDKLRGFRLGIDDYVTKPFSLAEMAARIRAVLARSAAPGEGGRRVYRLGDLVIDLNRRVIRRGGQDIALTPIEFRLLETLLESAGDVVSEADLLKKVWGSLKGEDSSAVRRYIWFLRQKLEHDPAAPQHILTVRGFGYRLGTGPLTAISEEETA